MKAALSYFTKSLFGRLVFGLLLIQLVTTPIFATIIYNQISESLREQFTSTVRSTAGSLLNSISLEGNDKQATISILEEAILSGQVLSAHVLLSNGALIESGLQNQTAHHLDKEDLVFGQHHDDQFIIKLLSHSSDAELWLSFDEVPTSDLILSTLRKVITASLFYIILSAALAAYWGKRMTNPLRELIKQANKVTNGDYQHEFFVNSSLVDIQRLLFSLNYMRSHLVDNAEVLEHQALHDYLTGLPNRALLNDRIHQAIAFCHRSKKSFKLFLIDLNKFKPINDTFGHQAGDKVLQECAQRFKKSLRSTDTISRLGGDEFGALLEDIDGERASAIAQLLSDKIKQPFDIGDQRIEISCSIGIVSYPSDAQDISDLMHKADVAMYEAKATKADYVHYSAKLDKALEKELIFANELNEGISNKEFICYFQPKIDIQNGRISGSEALARWNHPTRGLVPPSEFIFYAEKNHKIFELTKILFNDAFQKYAPLISENNQLRLAVNLSTYCFSDENIAANISEILAQAQYPAGSVDIEITESGLFHDSFKAISILDELQSKGIHIAIDDFGTGYSSLTNLRQFPISNLKIDRSFIAQMLCDKNDMAIVKASIEMAHNMGIRVVAEGVETQEQLSKLIALGCDEAQGYFFAKPLPIEELIKWQQNFSWVSYLPPESSATSPYSHRQGG